MDHKKRKFSPNRTNVHLTVQAAKGLDQIWEFYQRCILRYGIRLEEKLLSPGIAKELSFEKALNFVDKIINNIKKYKEFAQIDEKYYPGSQSFDLITYKISRKGESQLLWNYVHKYQLFTKLSTYSYNIVIQDSDNLVEAMKIYRLMRKYEVPSDDDTWDALGSFEK